MKTIPCEYCGSPIKECDYLFLFNSGSRYCSQECVDSDAHLGTTVRIATKEDVELWGEEL